METRLNPAAAPCVVNFMVHLCLPCPCPSNVSSWARQRHVLAADVSGAQVEKHWICWIWSDGEKLLYGMSCSSLLLPLLWLFLYSVMKSGFPVPSINVMHMTDAHMGCTHGIRQTIIPHTHNTTNTQAEIHKQMMARNDVPIRKRKQQKLNLNTAFLLYFLLLFYYYIFSVNIIPSYQNTMHIF